MTKADKHIKVLNEHLTHWERLLREGICEETEGKEIIEAFEAAIEAIRENKRREK